MEHVDRFHAYTFVMCLPTDRECFYVNRNEAVLPYQVVGGGS